MNCWLPLIGFNLQRDFFDYLRSDMDYTIVVFVLMIYVMLYVFYKHYIPTAHNRAFSIMLYTVLSAMAVEMASNVLLSYYMFVPSAINKLFVVLNLILRMAVLMSYLAYVLTNINVFNIFRGWRWNLIAVIPTIACALIVMSAFINSPKLVFFFDRNGIYHEGDLYFGIRIVTFLLLILSYVIVLIFKKKINRTTFITTSVFVLMVIIQVPVEILLAKTIHPYLVTYIGCCLGGLMIFLTFQNPDGYIDQVTGLFNREGFIVTMKDMYEYDKSFGILAFELLDYEAMIEMYGSEIENSLRKSLASYIYKLYGTKSVFILSESKVAILLRNSKELQKAAYKSATTPYFEVNVNGEDMQINFAGAVISCPENAHNFAKLVEIIEYGLAYAKKSYVEGGSDPASKLAVINDKILRMNQRENNVKESINDSVNKDELYVFYQPIFDLSTHKVTAAEAVCRLYNLDIGWIPTSEFIKLSEKSGQVIYIGQQVLSKVCRFIKSINMYELGLDYISVSMSPEQCIQANLAGDIMKTIENYRIPTDKIYLETVEPVQPKLADNMAKVVRELSAKGIGFTLDDYGAGFSNITNTLGLPFNVVKISKEIHQSYFEGKADILPPLIRTIKNLGFKVAVGDIDTAEQAKVIEELGCDYAQGEYYAKVMNAYDFKEYVAKINGASEQ
ncbi:MAG: EAL domain-containing protein [Lachnospiraceae bacterium]|nr:EAL domain-containing protein [Lachnospiraceae bacterium]